MARFDPFNWLVGTALTGTGQPPLKLRPPDRIVVELEGHCYRLTLTPCRRPASRPPRKKK